jgi:hypothetical protein
VLQNIHFFWSCICHVALYIARVEQLCNQVWTLQAQCVPGARGSCGQVWSLTGSKYSKGSATWGSLFPRQWKHTAVWDDSFVPLGCLFPFLTVTLSHMALVVALKNATILWYGVINSMPVGVDHSSVYVTWILQTLVSLCIKWRQQYCRLLQSSTNHR